MIDPFLLTAQQGAAFLGVSLRKFRDLSHSEGFPAGRPMGERSTRWVRTELQEYALRLPASTKDKSEPEHLVAARKARKDRRPTANAPFPCSRPHAYAAGENK